MTPNHRILIEENYTRNGRAAADMLAASFSFATMSCIAHAFQGNVAWPLLAFIRIGMTMVAALVLVRAARVPVLLWKDRALWWRSFMGTVSLLCTFYALAHLPVTDSVTIFSMGPVWIAIILAVGFGRRAPWHTWLLAGLALAGVFLMERPRFSAETWPLAVAMFGSMTAAGAMVSLSFCGRLNMLTVVSQYSVCATLTTLILCFALPGTIVFAPASNGEQWLWLIPMGITGTIGQLFLTSAYGRGSPTLVALIGISQILFAAVYDLILWHETFDGLKIAGVALIALSIGTSILLNAAPAGNGGAESVQY